MILALLLQVAYVCGSILGIWACIWIKLGSNPEFVNYEVYIVAIIIGIAGSIVLVTSLGITADLIGDKTGSGAFVYGIMSFTDKLANGIAVVAIQDMLVCVVLAFQLLFNIIC